MEEDKRVACIGLMGTSFLLGFATMLFIVRYVDHIYQEAKAGK